jgi:hypothetical protein
MPGRTLSPVLATPRRRLLLDRGVETKLKKAHGDRR